MSANLSLFEGFGIEIEYVIVNAETLDILPIGDLLIGDVTGKVGDGDAKLDGGIGLSNELVLHLIELKNDEPWPDLSAMPLAFRRAIDRLNEYLSARGALLLPTGMHPWMKPSQETKLWPHEYSDVYRAYDEVFDCKRHGWANLQSTHINLPFADDDEFERLHAAVRLVLPLIPALAAASPIFEGRHDGVLDNRLAVYRNNAAKVPRVTGQVIPEPIFTIDDYYSKILEPLYRDIAEHEPDGILQNEWLNARGAIARFDRDAIEIRLVDCQETPRADIAIAYAVVAVVRALVEGRYGDLATQKAFAVAPLTAILTDTTRSGENASIGHDGYLAALGRGRGPMRAGDVWAELIDELLPDDELGRTARFIARQGTLATRMLAAIGDDHSRGALVEVYRRLAEGLAADRLLGE